jgi:hypothetical protein
MANPNIVAVASIYGKTQVVNLTTTTSDVITNSSASDTVIKLNTVLLSNYTANAVEATVMINRSSTVYYLAGAVVVPAKSTLVLIAKDSMIYLEEGDVLQANTSTNSALSLTVSYELIGSE